MDFTDIDLDYRLLTNLLHTWLLNPSPHERCALLTGHRVPDGRIHVTAVVEAPNRSQEPETSFEIHSFDVGISRDEIVGVLHTHLDRGDSLPSSKDVEEIGSWFGLVWNEPSQSLCLFDKDGWHDIVEPAVNSKVLTMRR